MEKGEREGKKRKGTIVFRVGVAHSMLCIVSSHLNGASLNKLHDNELNDGALLECTRSRNGYTLYMYITSSER